MEIQFTDGGIQGGPPDWNYNPCIKNKAMFLGCQPDPDNLGHQESTKTTFDDASWYFQDA